MEQTQIIGHIGRDAEIKNIAGTDYSRFTVAVYRSYKNKDGEKVESTKWYNAMTKQIKISEYLKKGVKVFLQGNLRASIYQDKNGQNQISLDLNADRIEILSKKETE